ncbi:DNA replication complex GINS protein PSF1-like [Haemaphysalis longicornis]
MVLYVEKALELVKELKRSRGWLPPLKEDALRDCLADMQALFSENQADVEAHMERHATVHARHVALSHIRRCLLAYLYQRLMAARDMRWGFGSTLAADLKQNLSEQEQQWLSRYSSLLADYMSSVGLDLARYRSPPKSLYVQVRCLQDYGDFETEDGTTIVLARDTTHFLERSQCEKLIHQGIVEHVVTS